MMTPPHTTPRALYALRGGGSVKGWYISPFPLSRAVVEENMGDVEAELPAAEEGGAVDQPAEVGEELEARQLPRPA